MALADRPVEREAFPQVKRRARKRLRGASSTTVERPSRQARAPDLTRFFAALLRVDSEPSNGTPLLSAADRPRFRCQQPAITRLRQRGSTRRGQADGNRLLTK